MYALMMELLQTQSFSLSQAVNWWIFLLLLLIKNYLKLNHSEGGYVVQALSLNPTPNYLN